MSTSGEGGWNMQELISNWGHFAFCTFHFMVALQFAACIMQPRQKRECKEEGRKKGNMENKKRGGGKG